jgi:hypothetical protein
MIELYADFNDAAADGSLPLTSFGSLRSIAGVKNKLAEGLVVFLTDGDLSANATLGKAADGTWYARPGWEIVVHKPGENKLHD